LTLIDMDHVSESNVNRQIHALTPTLGMSKIEAMRQRIALIHPNCKVLLVEEFVSPDNWPSLLPPGVDAVIDACDQVRSKTAMSHWARETGATFISVGAAGGKRLAQKAEIADLSKVTHDPLLAQMRYRLRKFHGAPQAGEAMGVACVFSAESVHSPLGDVDISRDATLNCHGYGSIVTVTATFGLCAAGWVIDKLSRLSRP
jgi:tRNA A37 threonylcarbamoyladenosine dehydratase